MTESLQPVRRDCAFCHRERSAKDDNHAPNCPYWDFFGPDPDADSDEQTN